MFQLNLVSTRAKEWILLNTRFDVSFRYGPLLTVPGRCVTASLQGGWKCSFPSGGTICRNKSGLVNCCLCYWGQNDAFTESPDLLISEVRIFRLKGATFSFWYSYLKLANKTGRGRDNFSPLELLSPESFNVLPTWPTSKESLNICGLLSLSSRREADSFVPPQQKVNVCLSLVCRCGSKEGCSKQGKVTITREMVK